MKGDTHIRWLLNILHHQKHTKQFASGVPTNKSNFARISGSLETNPRFTQFFHELVEKNIMIQIGKEFILEPERAWQYIQNECDSKPYEKYHSIRTRRFWFTLK